MIVPDPNVRRRTWDQPEKPQVVSDGGLTTKQAPLVLPQGGVTILSHRRREMHLAENTVFYGEKQTYFDYRCFYLSFQNPPRFFFVREARIRPGFFPSERNREER